MLGGWRQRLRRKPDYGTPFVNIPMSCFSPGTFSRPGTASPCHQVHIAHSFLPISLNGLIIRILRFLFPFALLLSTETWGVHSSWASSLTTKPPPCAIEDMREMERDVRDVPKRRCDEPVDSAVWRRRSLVRVCIALWMAVWVGSDEI